VRLQAGTDDNALKNVLAAAAAGVGVQEFVDANAAANAALDAAIGNAPRLIAEALEDFDFRRATEAVWRIADEANRYVNHTRPWDLAKAGDRAELAAERPAARRGIRVN
ncbi:MAG: methionyl-tRNA synthetase, partial [Trebonia sp.]|nr:methionyl-tRNA synthetase [Trebonia sp.]